METSTLTGLSEGDFHTLRVLSGGVMTDILTLIVSGGGGGGAVSSATAPLAINSGVLSIDLAAYATTSAVNTLMANYTLTSSLFSGVSVGQGLVAVTGSGTLSLGLSGLESRTALKLQDSQGTVRDLTSSTAGELTWNTSQVALTSDVNVGLAGKHPLVSNYTVGTSNNFTLGIDTPSLRVNFSGGNARMHVMGDASLANEVLFRVEQGYGLGEALAIHKTNNAAFVGIRTYTPSEALHVVGNILATGSITGASKSFDIEHPDPALASDQWRLRHWCVESGDSPGGMLMYRRTVETTSTSASIEMPNWFQHLCKDVIIFVTPKGHFGSGWAEYNNNRIDLKVSTTGSWHLLITAARKDHCATHECPQEVEYRVAAAELHA